MFDVCSIRLIWVLITILTCICLFSLQIRHIGDVEDPRTSLVDVVKSVTIAIEYHWDNIVYSDESTPYTLVPHRSGAVLSPPTGSEYDIIYTVADMREKESPLKELPIDGEDPKNRRPALARYAKGSKKGQWYFRNVYIKEGKTYDETCECGPDSKDWGRIPVSASKCDTECHSSQEKNGGLPMNYV